MICFAFVIKLILQSRRSKNSSGVFTQVASRKVKRCSRNYASFQFLLDFALPKFYDFWFLILKSSRLAILYAKLVYFRVLWMLLYF